MPFDKTVILPVDLDTAFALITEPSRLRRWKTVAARIDLHLGGEYRWTITPGNSAMGTFSEIHNGKKIVFSWGWEGSSDLPPGASTVSITLEKVEGGTSVRLVHEGLNPEQEKGHAEGWTHYLDRLVDFATNGDIEADPWSAAPDPIDPFIGAEAALAIAQRTLRAISRDDLLRPTPCSEFNVSQLAEHQRNSLERILQALGIEIQPSSQTNLEDRLADLAQPLIEGFRKRGLEGSINFGGRDTPAIVIANLLTIELFVHAWDLAQATGQDFKVSSVVTDYVLDIANATINADVRSTGLFAPALSISDSATSLDRLIAFAGREISTAS